MTHISSFVATKPGRVWSTRAEHGGNRLGRILVPRRASLIGATAAAFGVVVMASKGTSTDTDTRPKTKQVSFRYHCLLSALFLPAICHC